MRHAKLLGSKAVLAIILVGVFSYLFTSSLFSDWVQSERTVWGYKIAIRRVSFDNANPNTLRVEVYFISNPGRTATITRALVKNSASDAVAEGEVVPNVVPVNTNTTLTLNLNNNLTSGTYTVSLYTDVKGMFASPKFTIP